MTTLTVGTRGSALALAQTELVIAALQRRNPAVQVRIERIVTTGDARADVPLAQLGRGVFVTEIESALRAGRIDFAVHSAKDLPSTLASDLQLAAFLPRADARDVVVSPHGGIRTLPRGARVGTSSPRRAALLRALRPDVHPVDVRGNVDTRLRKLHNGEFDAIILAAAGLIRLGRRAEITEWLDPDDMIPSVGQGALALECRADDARTSALLRVLDDAATRLAVTAERAFLAELGAGCRAAAGAHAFSAKDGLTMTAFVGGSDGRHVRLTETMPIAGAEGGASALLAPGAFTEAAAFGSAVAAGLLRAGAAEFLAHDDSALAGQRIAITRPQAQAHELMELLRANGAAPLACPTIEVAPAEDMDALDAAVASLRPGNWMVFTSVNAVEAVAGCAAAKALVDREVKLAAVGAATARAVATKLGQAAFVPSAANARVLAAELPAAAGDRVLFPRGDLAHATLADGLRARGVLVDDVIAYRTVASAEAATLAQMIRAGQVDAIIFTSPSTVRCAQGLHAAIASAETRPLIVCIGPTTADAARAAGMAPDAEAETHTVGGIVEVLERAFASRRAPAGAVA